jgi:Bacterial membrane protein YfhO
LNARFGRTAGGCAEFTASVKLARGPNFMAPTDSTEVYAPAAATPAEDRSFHRRDLGAMAVLTGLVVLLFWRVLFTSDMLFFRDVFNYSYPHARLIHEICRRGRLPYWNPYLNWGQPLLSNPNTLFFYPYTLVMVLLPINLAYPLHYVLHISLAALGTYWLARRWGQSRLAAFFAGSFFALSGPVVSLGNFYNMVACAAWIPWALVATDWAVESRASRAWVLLTLVFTMQFLAGEPMTLMATFGLATLYALWRKGNFRKPFSPANLRLLAGFFGVGCVMMALAAVQFIPSLHLLFNARRGNGLTWWQAGYWSFHPLLLLEIVMPNFFGTALGDNTPWEMVLNSNAVPLLLSYFLGFIPLFLALAGWMLSRDPRRNFLAGGAALFLLLAVGRFTPVYQLLFWSIPLLRLVRFPVKLIVPAFLLVAILAGWGFDTLRAPGDRLQGWRKKVLLPLVILLGLSAGVWAISWIAPQVIARPAGSILVRTDRIFTVSPGHPLKPHEVEAASEYFVTAVRIHFPGLIGFALGALAWMMALERGKRWARQATPWIALAGVAVLVNINYGINPTAPKWFYDYRPPVLEHFQASAQPYRFCDISQDREAAHRPPPQQTFVNFDSVPEAAGFSGQLMTTFLEKIQLSAGTMLTGKEAATAIDVDASLSEPYYDFWAFERAQVGNKTRYDCLLGRANMKYLVTRTREDSAATRQVAEIFNGSPAPAYLYEDLCATPRAFAAGAAMDSPSADETLQRLSDPAFDATGEVILAGKPRGAPAAEKPGPAGSVEILDRQPSSVALRANLDRPGYVVLLDRFDPNWHATLDGREVQILRADEMFRAVECPAGRHEIRFYYRQAGLAAGALISLATAVFLALVFWRNPQVPIPSTET